MMRKALAAAYAAAIAAACAGCVQITGERAEQLDLIGDVSVVTSLGAEGIQADARRGADACGSNELGRAQLLLAHRIPDGSRPAAAPASSLGLAFRADEAYARQLTAEHGVSWAAW